MTSSEQLKPLVDQMPDPNGRGLYTENIDKEKIEAAAASIYKGGRENIQGLIEMLGEPGTPENVKPHYALHCVLNHALIVDDDRTRRDFAVTLANNLSGDLSTYNKAYLCQELQWLGGEEAVESLAQLLDDEDLVEPATMALVAIQTGAVAALRTALPQSKGKCRLNIIHALAALADADSAKELTTALGDEDQEVRIAARAGLSKIAETTAARAVLGSVEGTSGWERIQAAKSCLVMAETLAAGGRTTEAHRVYARTNSLFDGPDESHVREAVSIGERALSQ